MVEWARTKSRELYANRQTAVKTAKNTSVVNCFNSSRVGCKRSRKFDDSCETTNTNWHTQTIELLITICGGNFKRGSTTTRFDGKGESLKFKRGLLFFLRQWNQKKKKRKTFERFSHSLSGIKWNIWAIDENWICRYAWTLIWNWKFSKSIQKYGF